jgi:hypothetical protein
MAHVSYIEAVKLINLLKEAGSGQPMFVRVHSANQLALGSDPLEPSLVIDLSKEVLRPIGNAEISKGTDPIRPKVESPENTHKKHRQTGKYLLEIKGKTTECGSLKQLLAEGLKTLEFHRSGTLERLSTIKPRTKRIVAHSPDDLFDDPKLARQYSEKLMPNWWFGTNNSAQETNAWLERACALAGLKWGESFLTSI